MGKKIVREKVFGISTVLIFALSSKTIELTFLDVLAFVVIVIKHCVLFRFLFHALPQKHFP